uniref:Uncharacterized protein n=1 Tax=Oryza glumipatula TaxID=40148 RepID=A0A0E0AFK3_9ORYZ
MRRRGLRLARRKGGSIGHYAATGRCSATTVAVPPRSAPLGRIWRVAGYGGRRRRPTCDGWRQWWLRQLAVVATSADDADVVLASLRGAISAVSLCWSSGGRSRLAAAGPVLAFTWACVLAMSVCGWWFFFPFSWLRPSRVVIL